VSALVAGRRAMNILQSIEGAARERGLSFVVIGGLAVIEHGHLRLTADFDFLVPREARDRWHALLLDLGYNAVQQRDAFGQYAAPEGAGWPVDLMFVNEVTFQGIQAAAKPIGIQGARVRLVSLEHLLALKLHALKHSHLGRFLKDFDDVTYLAKANKIDLRSPAIRDLFLKYGNSDLYEKICRACGGQ
jgi:predicted nucleotidyltransferase